MKRYLLCSRCLQVSPGSACSSVQRDGGEKEGGKEWGGEREGGRETKRKSQMLDLNVNIKETGAAFIHFLYGSDMSQ